MNQSYYATLKLENQQTMVLIQSSYCYKILTFIDILKFQIVDQASFFFKKINSHIIMMEFTILFTCNLLKQLPIKKLTIKNIWWKNMNFHLTISIEKSSIGPLLFTISF